MGTQCTTSTKKFDSAAAAQAEKDKLISSNYVNCNDMRSKTVKDYKKCSRITDSQKLVDILIPQAIDSYVTSTGQLPVMLQDIDYIHDIEYTINKITFYEILDAGGCEIKASSVDGGNINFTFTMSVVLTAWKNKKQIFRTATAAVGECCVPNKNMVY